MLVGKKGLEKLFLWHLRDTWSKSLLHLGPSLSLKCTWSPINLWNSMGTKELIHMHHNTELRLKRLKVLSFDSLRNQEGPSERDINSLAFCKGRTKETWRYFEHSKNLTLSYCWFIAMLLQRNYKMFRFYTNPNACPCKGFDILRIKVSHF